MENDTRTPNGSNPNPPLLVNASQKFSTAKSQIAAVREFVETGVSVQGPTHSTLQAILDHCFKKKRSFSLHWKADTGTFTIQHEHKRIPSARVIWEVKGKQKDEPILLSAELGVIRATIANSSSGWQLMTGGLTYKLHAATYSEAKEEATGFLRTRLTSVLAILSEEK